jgi:hypothetical protein
MLHTTAGAAASAAAGIGCLNMSECDVTTQGEVGIVITQRMNKRRGPGETMVVEVFQAVDSTEAAAWMAALNSIVARDSNKSNFNGIPFSSFRLPALASSPCVMLPLEGLDMQVESSYEQSASITVVPALGSISILQSDGQPITAPSTVVLDTGWKVQLQFDPSKFDEADVFSFLLRTEGLQSENTARVHVKRLEGSARTGRSTTLTKAQAPQVPGLGATGSISPRDPAPISKGSISPRDHALPGRPESGVLTVSPRRGKDLPSTPSKKELPPLPPKRTRPALDGGPLSSSTPELNVKPARRTNPDSDEALSAPQSPAPQAPRSPRNDSSSVVVAKTARRTQEGAEASALRSRQTDGSINLGTGSAPPFGRNDSGALSMVGEAKPPNSAPLTRVKSLGPRRPGSSLGLLGEVDDAASSAPGSPLLPLVDGAVAEFMVEVTLFQKVKRQLKNGKWVDVVEDLTRVQTPEAIQARHELRELLLSHMQCERDASLVRAVLTSIPSTETDMIVQSIVNIYASVDGLLIPLIKSFIKEEVRMAQKAETLFRVNSFATKMMKFFSDIVGDQFLRDTLAGPINDIMQLPANALEVDPEKLKPDDDVEANGAALLDTCRAVLAAIYESRAAMPPVFSEVCECLWIEVSQKFPDASHTAVAGFLFLRFFCPSIVAPESHGLSTKKNISRETRRALTLVAKVLQQLANGVEFGKKEEFMAPFNDFVMSELSTVRLYLESAADVALSPDEALACIPPIPKAVIERSLDNIYKQLLLQRKKVCTFFVECLASLSLFVPKIQKDYPAVATQIQPIIRMIGVPDKLRRALTAQGQATGGGEEKKATQDK